MKKKQIVLIIIGLILVIGIYFGYKGFNLYYYNISNITFDEYEEFIEGFKVKNTININNVKTNEYLNFNEIKIRNDFKKFEKIDDGTGSKDFIKYKITYGDKKVAAIFMGKTDTYINLLKNDFDVYGNGDRRLKKNNVTDILNKNNITNDIELFEYLRKNKDIKSNIFTSVKDMKNNFTINYLLAVMLPKVDNITIIDGDYSGYIFNMGSNKEVSIFKNNKRYVFTFINTDYFTDQYIQELLSTVVIENK